MPKAPKDAWSASDGGEAELRDGMILARDATRLSAMNGPMTSRQGRAPLRPGHHLLEEDASGRAAWRMDRRQRSLWRVDLVAESPVRRRYRPRPRAAAVQLVQTVPSESLGGKPEVQAATVLDGDASTTSFAPSFPCVLQPTKQPVLRLLPRAPAAGPGRYK